MEFQKDGLLLNNNWSWGFYFYHVLNILTSFEGARTDVGSLGFVHIWFTTYNNSRGWCVVWLERWEKGSVSVFSYHHLWIWCAKALILLYYLAFDDLFATVTFLLRNSPESTFITSYHNRRYFPFSGMLELVKQFSLKSTLCIFYKL